MWTVLIIDLTAHSVPSDLDLYCTQNLLVSLSVRKELNWIQWYRINKTFKFSAASMFAGQMGKPFTTQSRVHIILGGMPFENIAS